MPPRARLFWHLLRGIYTAEEGHRDGRLNGIPITLCNLTKWQNQLHLEERKIRLRLAPNYLKILHCHGSCLPVAIRNDVPVLEEDY